MSFAYLRAMLVGMVFLLAAPLHASDQRDQIKARYLAAQNAIKTKFGGFSIPATPQAAKSLEEQWQAISDWAAAFLSAHPQAGADELRNDLQQLDPDLSVSVLNLAPQTWVVATHLTEIGNVFIVKVENERFKIAWSISEPARSTSPYSDLLMAWSAENARDDCSVKYKTRQLACGPLYTEIRSLPATAAGNPRFYLPATYAQAAGGTVEGQLSIWEWTGETARPLMVAPYTYMIDQSQGIELKGNLLHVGVKDSFRTFYACGSCEGRQRDWVFRITPEGVEDLGKASLVPELDTIDELFYRIEEGLPTDTVASPGAAAIARKALEVIESLGMLGQWRIIKHRAGSTVVCFSTDGIAPHLFTMKSAGQTLYISHVEETTYEMCEQPKDQQ